MAFNGSGTYTRSDGVRSGSTIFQSQQAAGIDIVASWLDAEANDMATALSNCLCKDGQQTATADQPMGTYKHTNVGNAAARTQYAACGQVQDGAFAWGATSTGAAGAYAITVAPSPGAYANGQRFSFRANHSSPVGGSTLNVNSLGAIPIHMPDANAIGAEQIATNQIVDVIYTDLGGASFRLQAPPCPFRKSWTPTFDGNNAMTFTDTTSVTYYSKIGNLTFIYIDVRGTIGGTPDAILTCTLPFATPAGGNFQVMNGYAFNNATNEICICTVGPSTSLLRAYHNDFTEWTPGYGGFSVNGFYFST